jgi:hypothetical protein
MNPPPWIQTITGSFAPEAALAGRHRLINKQSSDEVGDIEMVLGPNVAWAQSAPNLPAYRSPCQAGNGCGGRQRYSPTGGAAKGIPLKLETSPSVTPRTIPEAVRTVGAAGAVLTTVFGVADTCSDLLLTSCALTAGKKEAAISQITVKNFRCFLLTGIVLVILNARSSMSLFSGFLVCIFSPASLLVTYFFSKTSLATLMAFTAFGQPQ